MSKVVIVNDNKLGSHPVFTKARDRAPRMTPPQPKRRLFPIEGKTETPNAKSYQPKAYNDGGPPSIDNGYHNNYPISAAQLGIRTHEGTVNNLI